MLGEPLESLLAAKLLVSGMFLLSGLYFTKVIVQSVQPLLPRHAVRLHPIGNFLKACGMDPAGTPLGGSTTGDQACLFKHL